MHQSKYRVDVTQSTLARGQIKEYVRNVEHSMLEQIFTKKTVWKLQNFSFLNDWNIEQSTKAFDTVRAAAVHPKKDTTVPGSNSLPIGLVFSQLASQGEYSWSKIGPYSFLIRSSDFEEDTEKKKKRLK